MPNAYEDRMIRVLGYIFDNSTGDLSLDVLADVAAMSRFHWHRVFVAMTGETCAQAVRRVRLARGAALQDGLELSDVPLGKMAVMHFRGLYAGLAASIMGRSMRIIPRSSATAPSVVQLHSMGPVVLFASAVISRRSPSSTPTMRARANQSLRTTCVRVADGAIRSRSASKVATCTCAV